MGMTTATTQRSEELAVLVGEHQAGLWRYLRYLGCEPGEADDLTQETFVVLFQSAEADRSSAQTAAFLRGVARNRLLMLRRRQGREPSTVEWDLADSVWNEASVDGHLQDYLDALADCLETALQPRVRRAIDLHYAERASRDEIARQLEMTAIHPFDAVSGEPKNLQVPINVRFFAGGSSTHRAFRTDYLGIEGQALSDGEPVGGNAMVLLNLEYLRPLSSFLTGVVFVDGGNVWASPGEVRAGDLRWGAGAGLRLGTPAGLFRLEYGHKLDREEGESSGEVYLSFGIPF